MTTFSDFKRRIKMRHDFSDQIQVRYLHPDGQNFDTWVSGNEVLSRLHSEAAEQQLKSLNRYDWKKLLELKDTLPDRSQDFIESRLRNKFADEVDDFVGESLIGDSMVSAIKGEHSGKNQEKSRPSKWTDLLRVEPFREKVIELAWIQLEGSLPESQSDENFDDWI